MSRRVIHAESRNPATDVAGSPSPGDPPRPGFNQVVFGEEWQYIQHSAEISGGNSGGPLIYEDGTVLGINTLVTFDQNRPGVGVKYYAIGINQAVSEVRGRVPELFPR